MFGPCWFSPESSNRGAKQNDHGRSPAVFPLTLPLAAMVIAVNTRFLLADRMEGYGYFIKEVFNRIARAHPEHQFYFLFDRPFSPSHIQAPNIKGLVVAPAARHPY